MSPGSGQPCRSRASALGKPRRKKAQKGPESRHERRLRHGLHSRSLLGTQRRRWPRAPARSGSACWCSMSMWFRRQAAPPHLGENGTCSQLQYDVTVLSTARQQQSRVKTLRSNCFGLGLAASPPRVRLEPRSWELGRANLDHDSTCNGKTKRPGPAWLLSSSTLRVHASCVGLRTASRLKPSTAVSEMQWSRREAHSFPLSAACRTCDEHAEEGPGRLGIGDGRPLLACPHQTMQRQVAQRCHALRRALQIHTLGEQRLPRRKSEVSARRAKEECSERPLRPVNAVD